MNNIQKNSNFSDSSSTSTKKLNKKKKYKFQLYNCLKNCFIQLFKKLENLNSKLSLPLQILLFSIPFSIALYFTIFLGYYYGYERMFKFEFYNTVKNEFLKYFIKDADNAHLEVGIAELKTGFEHLDNLFLFQIYFKELISMGLLDDDPSIKIFPNISKNSETIYEYLDSIQIENQINTVYKIPKTQAEENIDNRQDHFSELGKIYFNLLPHLTYESFLKRTYINETYLIAYEFDENKNILGDEFYFAFPKLKTELAQTNFFTSTNSHLSPNVEKNKINITEKLNDPIYVENWFTKQDYIFRETANEKYWARLSFADLNYNYYGKLNKSNIISLQNYFNVNNKNYIINIIYFINEKELIDGNFDHSIFLLFNNSLNKKESEKYTDNDTFLIFKSNILELSLSEKFRKYFYYGMKNLNSTFFKYGISFDSFDIEKLAEPIKNYKSSENFNVDLRYFSALYLFTLLFKNLEYERKKEEYKDVIQLEFNSSEGIIENICKEYNFSLYIKYLIKEEINCWDDNTMLYYSGESSEKPNDEETIGEYFGKPYCICLPLFCLKNNEKKIDTNNIQYVNQISLPSECQNIYKAQTNKIEEKFKSHKQDYYPKLAINYKLNDLNIFNQNISNALEDEYYIFKKEEITQFFGVSVMIVTLVDETDLKLLNTLFIVYVDYLKAYFLLIILIGIFVSFLITDIFIYINIRKISKIIFDYKKIHEDFLNKLHETSYFEKKEKIENNIGNIKNKKKSIVKFQSNSLIKIDKENNTKNIQNILHLNENPLFEELIKLFYSYYKISKYELIENNDEILFDEENELYFLLKNISIFIPKFKLEVTMDYNFYIKSRLNQSYIKNLPKNEKANHQQIMLTQSIIYELLSTEIIEDCGLITNFYFKYITNINLNLKSELNPIKSSLFDCVMPAVNEEESELYENINNDNQLIDNSNRNLYIVRREENTILEEFEKNIENDDYLKKEKLIACFDSFLVNVYYKYLNKLSKK